MYPVYISMRFTWCKAMFIWTIQGEWKSRNKWWHSGTPCFTSGFRVRLVWGFVIFLFNSCLWTVNAFVFEPTIQGEAQSLIKYQVSLPVLKFVLCEFFFYYFSLLCICLWNFDIFVSERFLFSIVCHYLGICVVFSNMIIVKSSLGKKRKHFTYKSEHMFVKK